MLILHDGDHFESLTDGNSEVSEGVNTGFHLGIARGVLNNFYDTNLDTRESAETESAKKLENEMYRTGRNLYKEDQALAKTLWNKQAALYNSIKDYNRERSEAEQNPTPTWLRKSGPSKRKNTPFNHDRKDPQKFIYGYCDLPSVTQAKIEVHNQVIKEAKIPHIKSFWDLFKTSKQDPDKP